MKKKQVLLEMVRVLVTLGAIAFLLFTLKRNQVSAGDIAASLKSVRPGFLISGFLLFTVTVFLLGYRLKIMLKAQAIEFHFRDLVALTFVGFFFNNFLPSAIGGDAAKIFYVTRRTKKVHESFTSIFADRVIGLSSMILIAGIALIFAGHMIEQKKIILIIAAMMLAVFAFFTVAMNRTVARRFRFLLSLLRIIRLDNFVRKVYDLFNSYKGHGKVLFLAFVYSFILQSCSIFVNVLLSRGLSLPIPTAFHFLFIPIIWVISLVPSLGGLGVRENGYILLYGRFVSTDSALTLSLLFLLVLLGVGVIGGFIYAFDRKFRFKIESEN